MATERSTDIKVGLTVIVGLIALFLGISWGKGHLFGSKPYFVRALFKTTGGLAVQDVVSINGVTKGAVSGVDPQGNQVLVTMQFDSPPALRKDARANITMLELMGGKKVELWLGDSPERFPDTALVPGEFSGDVGTLVEMVTSLRGTLLELTMRGDTLLGSLNGFFQNGEFKRSVNMTIEDAQKTLTHFDETATRVNKMLDDNAEPIKHTLAQAEIATKDLADLLQEDGPTIHALLDTTGHVMTSAHSLILRATTVFGELDGILASASEKGTLLNKLTMDKEIGRRLDNLVTSLILFIEQTRKGGLDANIRFWDSNKPDTVNLRP